VLLDQVSAGHPISSKLLVWMSLIADCPVWFSNNLHLANSGDNEWPIFAFSGAATENNNRHI